MRVIISSSYSFVSNVILCLVLLFFFSRAFLLVFRTTSCIFAFTIAKNKVFCHEIFCFSFTFTQTHTHTLRSTSSSSCSSSVCKYLSCVRVCVVCHSLEKFEMFMCTHWNLYQSTTENLYDLWQYLHKYKVTDGWWNQGIHIPNDEWIKCEQEKKK